MRLRDAALMGVLGLGLGLVASRAGDRPSSVERRAPAVAVVEEQEGGRLFAVAINGGGAPASNYQSHLRHVQALVRFLEAAGVPRRRITLFSGDGEDPAPDQAARLAQPERDFWLVEGTPAEAALRTPVELVNSSVEGYQLFPATRAALAIWLLTARDRLRAGDTLLLYVTDHGSRDPAEPEGSRITLWGHEDLTARELGSMLDDLDPGVRVVAVMSQCFSGGFAPIWDAVGGGRNGCGYFSTTGDRRAYGCYPENRGRANVGHSFLFLRALAGGGGLAGAHTETVVSDATPDVPVRTSDLYLGRLLAAAAAARGQSTATFVDGLLGEAWRAPEAWSDETALLDQVADRFGMPGPSALATLEMAVHRLEEVVAGVGREATRAAGAVKALAPANLERFFAAQPQWRAVAEASPVDRDRAAGLVGALAGFTRADGAAGGRLLQAHEEALTIAGLSYRTEVRLAAAVRLRTLLTRLAGRVWLRGHASLAERRRFEALDRCERTPLPTPLGAVEDEPAASEAFPTWDQDAALAEALLPRALEAQIAAARVAPPPPATGLLAWRGLLPGALAGQRHLLAFWATWCKPCQRELPTLTALARARQVPLVAITDEAPEQVADFARGSPQSLPDNVVVDGGRQLFGRYEVQGLPTVLLLRADGSIEARTVGYTPLNDFGLGAN